MWVVDVDAIPQPLCDDPLLAIFDRTAAVLCVPVLHVRFSVRPAKMKVDSLTSGRSDMYARIREGRAAAIGDDTIHEDCGNAPTTNKG